MSDTHDHGAAACPFTAEELTQFQEADKTAARMVILLMTGIFLLGIALYAFVDYSVWPTN